MENTPTGCADDLPTILGIYKNDPKSRSVIIFFQRLDFAPNTMINFVYQPKLRPAGLLQEHLQADAIGPGPHSYARSYALRSQGAQCHDQKY